jgi:hypothetical protein
VGIARFVRLNADEDFAVSQLVPQLAATVAGEDLACGDYVSLLCETVELPSFLWDGWGAGLSPHELVRLRIMPTNAGQPLKVVAVCLPFVYVKTHSGELTAVDIRRTQLARLEPTCARRVWKQLKSQPRTTATA